MGKLHEMGQDEKYTPLSLEGGPLHWNFNPEMQFFFYNEIIILKLTK